VALLYFLIHIVAMAALPDLANSTTPLASAARNFLGPAGGLMLTVGAALSTAGSNHVNLLIGPRLLYAMGRAGTIPTQFAWLHPVYRAPSVSIVLYAATAWILAVSSAFGPLAALSGLARLLIYTTTCLSTAVLRIRTPPPPGGFRLPGGILIPVLALGVCAWLLAGSTVAQVIIVTIAVLGGAALYALARRYTP
jgi:amino acid transporter